MIRSQKFTVAVDARDFNRDDAVVQHLRWAPAHDVTQRNINHTLADESLSDADVTITLSHWWRLCHKNLVFDKKLSRKYFSFEKKLGFLLFLKNITST